MTAVTRDSALEALRAHVSERSFAHCVAVAETAETLARRFGADADDAWLAGLLHDWARDVSPRDLLVRAAELGIEVDTVDASVPYLLHARVARVELPSVLHGLNEQVLDAVERHTVGAGSMTDLDRVVYVADMIEPARRFDGVEELRHASESVDLAELYARAYALSLTHLVRARKYIHPESVASWNAIVDADRA